MKKNDTESGKKGFSEKQKQELKKYMVYGLMFFLFLGIMWFIFKPTAKQEEEENKGIGLNTEIPAPEKAELIGSKKNAYEQDYLQQKQKEKVKTLNNFALLAFSKTDSVKADVLVDAADPVADRKVNITPAQRYSEPSSSIRNSVDTYQKTNEALSSFYTPAPKESEEVQNLKNEIENLKEQIGKKQNETNRLDEQTALMERSYQLAAKYFPQDQKQSINPAQINSQGEDVHPVSVQNKKQQTVRVRQMSEDVVSALAQDMSNQEFVESFSQERNIGFYSTDEVGEDDPIVKNSIPVCIDSKQTVTDGQSVNLRLLVPVQVGSLVIPKNSVITGKGSIQGERMFITLNSIEYENSVIGVNLTAYALDGQKGIFIPDALEVNAVKEIAGNMGGNLGTSISLTHSAGQQIVGDLGKSLLQGTSQYIQKKVRTVKGNLKAGYRLLLVINEN